MLCDFEQLRDVIAHHTQFTRNRRRIKPSLTTGCSCPQLTKRWKDGLAASLASSRLRAKILGQSVQESPRATLCKCYNKQQAKPKETKRIQDNNVGVGTA